MAQALHHGHAVTCYKNGLLCSPKATPYTFTLPAYWDDMVTQEFPLLSSFGPTKFLRPNFLRLCHPQIQNLWCYLWSGFRGARPVTSAEPVFVPPVSTGSVSSGHMESGDRAAAMHGGRSERTVRHPKSTQTACTADQVLQLALDIFFRFYWKTRCSLSHNNTSVVALNIGCSSGGQQLAN